MRKSFAVFLLAALGGVAAPTLASAEVIDTNITIAAPTIYIPLGQGASGYFDVTITDTSVETLAQMQATLMLAGSGTGVSIVGADLGSASNGEVNDPGNPAYQAGYPDGLGDAAGASPNLLYPYVFAQTGYATENSAELLNGAWVYSDRNDAANSDATNTGTVELVPNTVYSLEQVYYQVLPSAAPGVYALTFDTNAPYNSSSNPGGDAGANYVNLISNFNTNNYEGTNVISGAIVIESPEPGSVVLMLLGALGLLGLGWRRARRAS